MTQLNCDFTPEEKLIKARVKLQKEKPFFSYLCLNLTLIETPECPTIGVDGYGNLYYNPKFVDSLKEEELKGVLCHEVMHCALEHPLRLNDRFQPLFNTANDAVINAILQADGMTLPKNGVVPNHNEIKIYGQRITNLTDKTSEEVYDVLWAELSKEFDRVAKQIRDYIEKEQAKGNGKGFDEHRYGKPDKDKDGKEKCPNCSGTGKCKKCNGQGCPDCNNTGKCKSCGGTGEVNKNKINTKNIDWKKVLMDACAHAREQGNLPAGMDRIVDKLLQTYIDWRGLLYRYITSQIPVDYTWARPSKKSHSLGIYLPAVERETIDVMVAIDTSGSISHNELEEFISEISGIVKSFKNVEITAIDCDAEVNGVYELRNATIEQVVNTIGKNLKGGGGTSHIPVFNWINKHKPMAKFVICFTDGYTSFPDRKTVKQPVLWVLAGEWRTEKNKIPFGDVIELPQRKQKE